MHHTETCRINAMAIVALQNGQTDRAESLWTLLLQSMGSDNDKLAVQQHQQQQLPLALAPLPLPLLAREDKQSMALYPHVFLVPLAVATPNQVSRMIGTFNLAQCLLRKSMETGADQHLSQSASYYQQALHHAEALLETTSTILQQQQHAMGLLVPLVAACYYSLVQIHAATADYTQARQVRRELVLLLHSSAAFLLSESDGAFYKVHVFLLEAATPTAKDYLYAAAA